MVSFATMNVASSCPLRVAAFPWQPRPGAFAVMILCKATFELRPGESPLATVQEPPWHSGVASDVAPFKRRVDVFVLGRAYPLQGHIKSITARLVVGQLSKAVVVHEHRGWIAEGFAPLSPTSLARTTILGRHATGWNSRDWNTRPLPENIDGAFFNVAPADQQLAEFVFDEPIQLEHLHPQHARLETKLARVEPFANVQRADSRNEEIRLRCDTLCFDTDRAIAMLQGGNRCAS